MVQAKNDEGDQHLRVDWGLASAGRHSETAHFGPATPRQLAPQDEAGMAAEVAKTTHPALPRHVHWGIENLAGTTGQTAEMTLEANA